MAPRLVLDTNILVSGLRSRRGASYRLLERIAHGDARPVLSVPLVFEYEAVLKRQMRVLGLTGAEVDALLDDFCLLAERHAVYYLWRPTLRNPSDELVLELAVGAGCPYIVTHNVGDFAGGEQFGVRICTPSQFLREMGDES